MSNQTGIVSMSVESDAAWNGYALIGCGGASVVSMTAPVANTPSLSSGGSLVSGTPYYWKVSAVNGLGETISSNEVTVTPSGANLTATVTWSAVAGAMSYKLFRTTTSGTYGASSLVASGILTTSYIDTGAALNAGTLLSVATDGFITLAKDPINALHAATKQYVDAVATGLDVKLSVRAGTTGALPAHTRSGNILTATANGAFPAQDGVTLVLNDPLLVKDEGGGTHLENGIYTLTQVGDGSNPWKLTRRTDADASIEVTSGMFTFITEGTLQKGEGWVLTTADPITLNTTALTFTQFTALGEVTAGNGMVKVLNTIHAIQSSAYTTGQLVFASAATTLGLTNAITVSGTATTFGGTVTLNADPTLALQAATKQYVDNAIAVDIIAGKGIVISPSDTIHFAQSSNYTAGAIPIATGTATMGFDAANLFWDSTNHRLGLGTNVPVDTISISSALSANRIALYNTSDMVTNYEQGAIYWATNRFVMASISGGTGTNRILRLLSYDVATGKNVTMEYQALAIPHLSFASSYSFATAGVHTQYATGSSASSGTTQFFGITPTVSQSGTAAYSALYVNVTESSVGSGSKLLLDLRVAGTIKFSVNNAGGVGIGTTSIQYGLFENRLTDAATNAVSNLCTFTHNSSGTVANNFGGRLVFCLQSSTTATQDAGGIEFGWTDATHATRTSYLSWDTVNSGSFAESMRLTPTKLILQSGVSLSVVSASLATAAAGLLQFNGDWYATKTGGTVRMGLGGSIFDHFADAGNTTTTETDLYSDTLPASLFGSNGHKVFADYGGTMVGHATATRQWRVYFGGTVILDTGALSITTNQSWNCRVLLVRASSSEVRYTVVFAVAGLTTETYVASGAVTGLTLTNTQILKITGQAAATGAATNDIVAKLGQVSCFALAA